MIPKIVHQIFIRFKNGKDLIQIPEFNFSHKKTQKWCDENKYQLKLWDEGEVYDLIREYYPEYEQLYQDF